MKGNHREALIASVLSSAAGLLTFLVIHDLWILSIWFILPIGLIIAGTGDLEVGWAYAEVRHRLPRRPWRTLVMIAASSVILSPAILLAEVRPPLYSVSPAGVANLTVSISEVIIRFVCELLLSSAITGGLLGWWLGRTRRAIVATATAGFIFAFGPGHNIPFIGGTSGMGKEIVIMAAVVFVASLVLVETDEWLVSHSSNVGNLKMQVGEEIR